MLGPCAPWRWWGLRTSWDMLSRLSGDQSRTKVDKSLVWPKGDSAVIQQAALKALEIQLSIKPANKAAALEAIHSFTLQTTWIYPRQSWAKRQEEQLSEHFTLGVALSYKIFLKYCSGLPTSINGRSGQDRGEIAGCHLTQRPICEAVSWEGVRIPLLS